MSIDTVALQDRMTQGVYDKDQVERAIALFIEKFEIDFGGGNRPQPNAELLYDCYKMAVIVMDLMTGNPQLAGTDVVCAPGTNAIAAGTQGQRQWTDLYPNLDLVESILGSSFDWNGFGDTHVIATENDSKNGIGMLMAYLLTGCVPRMFADIRTNWTPESIKNVTGVASDASSTLGTATSWTPPTRWPRSPRNAASTVSASVCPRPSTTTSATAQAEDFGRIVAIINAHNIGYFLYNSGNDSMETVNTVAALVQHRWLGCVGIRVPKTIDNDIGDSERKIIKPLPGIRLGACYWANLAHNADEGSLMSSLAAPCCFALIELFVVIAIIATLARRSCCPYTSFLRASPCLRWSAAASIRSCLRRKQDYFLIFDQPPNGQQDSNHVQ